MLQTVLFNKGVLLGSNAFFDFNTSIMVPVFGRTASDGLQQGGHDSEAGKGRQRAQKD